MMLVLLCLASVFCAVSAQGDAVTYIAQYLEPTFAVITNFGEPPNTLQARIEMYNSGTNDITDVDWTIFLCHVRLFEPSVLADPAYDGNVNLGDTGLTITHIDGCLYKLEPTDDFVGINAKQTLTVPVNSADWMVARTDVMPNWYVIGNATDAEPEVIQFTVGEKLNHVGAFDTEEKWKRTETDVYDPPTPQDRSGEYARDSTKVPNRIIPTPLEAELTSEYVKTTDDWKIYYSDLSLRNEAEFLRHKTGWAVKTVVPSTPHVSLSIDPDVFTDTGCAGSDYLNEAYKIIVDSETIEIIGESDDGVFYGIQTLLAMKDLNNAVEVQQGNITDCPRFGFRGLMIDVSRNFFNKETIIKVLNVMAMYKLNKFHFHLTDDEGWRLEIPDLPELTDIGSRRCHNLAQDECIIPQLGSGPSDTTSGSGYYSTDDYVEILTAAKELHIEVIPEFDMPGHGHAAIKSMEARYNNLKDSNATEAEKYLLSDLDDTSAYYTAQYFKDDAINPCLSSTMTFVQKVIEAVKIMHDKADNPLKNYHFGGDEVPSTAWINSTVCQEFMGSPVNNNELKRMFAVNVSSIVSDISGGSISLGSWEDGLMDADGNPFPIDEMSTDIYINCWSNIWEWGNGERAYKFANADYKVVLSHATHLYFDHPHEPHPDERGYYWATRFTATEKTFGYMPDNIYANIDTNRMGEPLTEEEVCDTGCEQLEDDKMQNILGMQAQLWSETVREDTQLEAMIYPRLLAVAERAWHKALWETETNEDHRNELRKQDWEEFANLLGHHELKRLGTDISFHLRPPGASISGGNLVVVPEFPGLEVQYEIEGQNNWADYSAPVSIPANVKIYLRTKAPDIGRYSITDVIVINGSASYHMSCLAVIFLASLLSYLLH